MLVVCQDVSAVLYPAIVLLPILSLAKDACAYFIAVCTYRLAAGKSRAELYLLPLVAIEVMGWIVCAHAQ